MLIYTSLQCVPRTLPPSEQCHHVKTSCSDSDTFLHLAYLRDYFCTTPSWRPALFVGFVIWLGFLFSTLGITASDFFCPNLATIAQTLGLDENVAGVTFLAFGNGSPDVFATFSAMRDNAAGLAIGELVGAASFIVSVVVGSMCIIKPFKVDAFPFLRDVGFFTVAVGLLLAVLWDGRLTGWEAGILVGVYGIYVCVVVAGTWWMKRRERRKRREAMVRNEYAEDEVPQIAFHDEEEPYQDERELALHLHGFWLILALQRRLRPHLFCPPCPRHLLVGFGLSLNHCRVSPSNPTYPRARDPAEPHVHPLRLHPI